MDEPIVGLEKTNALLPDNFTYFSSMHTRVMRWRLEVVRFYRVVLAFVIAERTLKISSE